MEQGRSVSLPTVISGASTLSKPKPAGSSLLRRELDKQNAARGRAVTLATMDLLHSTTKLAPSGPTSSLPRPAPPPAHSTALPVFSPKTYPPPSTAAKPVAPTAPLLSAHGAAPMKAEFARRLEARAQIEKDANSKKRGIDLIRPTYAAAPKAGGMKHVKKNKGAHTRYPFSPQQQMVVDVVSAGKSVFFTGSAGTGKSTLLREIVQLLPRGSTFVTASTGMAAVNIGGITLHQFAGIGVGTDPAPILVQRILKGKARENWSKVKVLIIDEISMVDADLFDKLEYIAREVRHNPYPFGGIQLICCGDFFQLPPVSRNMSAMFAFEATKWSTVIQCNIELTTVYRQQFVRILNELRHGKISPECKKVLEGCKTATLKVPEGIEATRLYPLNKDVDGMNQGLLDALPGKVHEFIAKDLGEEAFRKNLATHSPAPTVLQLKEGAQVILLKNLSVEQGLANGARGVVIGFDQEHQGLPIVRFISGAEKTVEPQVWAIEIAGHEMANRTQVPLRLGWAISIHKSQGVTLSFAEMSLKEVFEYGQAYVALSRVSSLAGLKLLDFNEKVVRAHPKVIRYYESFDNMARDLTAPAAAAPRSVALPQPDPASAPPAATVPKLSVNPAPASASTVMELSD